MSFAALDQAFLRWDAALPPEQLAAAHTVFHPRAVPAGTMLQRAGEPAREVSFIVRGLTRLFHVGESGSQRTQGFRAEGDLVCSYAAALRAAPSDQFIEALEPCELLVATRAGFARLCAGHPAWTEMIAAMTRQLFLDEERRHRQLLTDDATTRYRAFLSARPALAARLTQRQIAAYVGVTPEALSRIRRS